MPNWCKNSVPNLTPALVGRWRSKLHRRDQRVPCEAWQPRRSLRDLSSCRRLFLPRLGPLAVPSSSFFWTTHLVLGTRRRRRFKPPPRCFGHSSVVVVERHAPALDNALAMIGTPRDTIKKCTKFGESLSLLICLCNFANLGEFLKAIA